MTHRHLPGGITVSWDITGTYRQRQVLLVSVMDGSTTRSVAVYYEDDAAAVARAVAYVAGYRSGLVTAVIGEFRAEVEAVLPAREPPVGRDELESMLAGDGAALVAAARRLAETLLDAMVWL